METETELGAPLDRRDIEAKPQLDARGAMMSYISTPASPGDISRIDSIETRSKEEFILHTERTYNKAESFAGDVMHNVAMNLIWVHDVIDRFYNKDSHKCTPVRSEAAQMAILDMFINYWGYSVEESSEITDYSLCLMHDLVKTEKASSEHRREVARSAKIANVSVTTEVSQILSERYEGDIEPEVWGSIEPFIMFDRIREFTRNVMPQAVIIKACELIVNMENPSSSRQSAILQDVLEAESFYAPILEIMGYDGLASVLRSEAHKHRLERQGKGHLLKRARDMLEPIIETGIEKIATELFGEGRVGAFVSSVGEDRSTGKLPVHVGDGKVTTNHGEVDVKYRIKTEGSLAHKINTKGKDPADIVGFTVISEDRETSANNFVDFILNQASSLESRIASSKEKAFYVQCPSGYGQLIREKIASRGYDPDEICQFEPPESKEYIEAVGYARLEVMKATVIASGAPVEVQFVTKDERVRSRTGPVSHILYKYLSQLGDITVEEKKRIVEMAVPVIKEVYAMRDMLKLNSLDIGEDGTRRAWLMGQALAA